MSRFGATLVTAVAVLLGAAAGAGAGGEPGELAYTVGGDLWVANADGSSARRLTATGADSTPVWAPDGSRLVFVSQRDDASRVRSELYVVNADGSGTRRITSQEARSFYGVPAWSPDGTRLAVVAARAGSGPPDLLLVSAAGGSTWLTDDQSIESDVQWAAGDRLVYATPTDIRERVLGASTPTVLVAPAYSPALSPDGSRLAYLAWRDGLRTLHVADARGGNARAYRPGAEHAAAPLEWSPDGTRLAFTGQLSLGYSRYGEGFANHLWLLEPAGGSLRRLTGDPDDPRVPGLSAYSGFASWWPGGDRLFLQPGWGDLFVIGSDGQCGERYTVFGRVLGPLSWRPGASPAPAPLRCADLETRAAFARVYVGAGEHLSLEVTVRNAGNERATDVDVRLASLTNARGVSATTVHGACVASAAPPSCHLGVLEAGEVARVRFELAANRPGNVVTTVVATTTAGNAIEQRVEVAVGATAFACGIVGTWSADVLRGTTRNDWICAFPGADRIDGRAGNDRIEAGSGEDTVTGGSGRDSILGAGGRDVILVRDGERDVVSCGSERDTVVADRKDSVARDCERVLRR